MLTILYSSIAAGSIYHQQKKIQHTDSMLKLMSVLTKDMRYAESIADNSFETEGTNMCEVLDRIVAQGEARGEAIGIEKNRTEMIHNMLKENISVEVIARVAKLTVEQVIAISKKVAVL